jgi:hypothetical protein
MKFVNTKRFSPVIYLKDLPDKGDYFHKPYDQITKEFLASKDYVIDETWWHIQNDRCLYGYSVPNSIDKGGDAYIDGIDVIWTGNDCYIKDIDLLIKNKEVHISGKMYFYLNFWKIKRLIKEFGRKDIANPLFTDLSFENWQIRELMRTKGLDNMFAKTRQRGLSEEEACDTTYEYIFFNNSQNVIVAGQDQYNENTMNFCLRGLERLKNTQFYKQFAKGGERRDYIKTKYTGSEIYSRTAKGNPQAVSSLSPSSVKLEETGIWQRGLVRELSEFLKPSMESQGIKTGYKTFIGTGGDMQDGVFDMQQMFYAPEKHGLLTFDNTFEEGDTKIARFIPAWKFELIDDDGNSLKEEGIKKILQERANLSPAERYRYTTLKPLKPSELFMVSTGGYFGETISQWCNERIAFINNHREAKVEQRYSGNWINPKKPLLGVEMTPDANGPFIISEHPEKDKTKKVYNNLYRAGTDSYDQDEAHTSKSKGACWVKKGFLDANHTYDKFVAGILTRPSEEQGGSELFYEQTAMLCVYYNAINLIENSKIRIYDWYKSNGFTEFLKLRPVLVVSNWVDETKASNRYGIDPATKPFWLSMHKDWLRKKYNIDNCDHPILLDAWAKFRYDPSGQKYNCDITISTSLCLVAEEDEKEVLVKSNEKPKNIKELFNYFKSKDGKMMSGVNLTHNYYARTN